MSLSSFQYEVISVSPDDAIQTWLALREEGKGQFTPVILDSPEKYSYEPDVWKSLRRDLPKMLAAADAISVETFFSRRRSESPELYETLEAGDWPEVPDKLEAYLHRQMEEVFIAKVPTPNSFDAIAYIGFGGWNDCPTDEEHVAVMKYWHHRYGANFSAQGGDMIECTVDRPPTTKEEALILAREQLLYSPGFFGEFTGRETTIPRLAAALLNSRQWLFWWD